MAPVPQWLTEGITEDAFIALLNPVRKCCD